MAGHSHSANIAARKSKVDKTRGKVFSKMARDIMSAAREGGGDPAMNLRLRYAIDRARAVSMPRDNIERAVKKGCGELQGESIEEIAYEGFGPGGVAFVVQTLTDNRARTAPELRRVFEKRGGNLAAAGAVSWMFGRHGVFVVLRDGAPAEDAMLEIALDVGAEDMLTTQDAYEIRSAVADFHAVAKGLEAQGLKVEDAKLAWIPSSNTPVTDREIARQVLALIDDLDELEDVQTVAVNYDIPDLLLAELRAE